MKMESFENKFIRQWIHHALEMAEKETDMVGKAAYCSAAERLTKFPYTNGLSIMSEPEFRRILGWNKLRARIFKPKEEGEPPVA